MILVIQNVPNLFGDCIYAPYLETCGVLHFKDQKLPIFGPKSCHIFSQLIALFERPSNCPSLDLALAMSCYAPSLSPYHS